MRQHVVITFVKEIDTGKLLTSRSVIDCVCAEDAVATADALRDIRSPKNERIALIALRIYDVMGRPIYVNPAETLQQLDTATTQVDHDVQLKPIKKWIGE